MVLYTILLLNMGACKLCDTIFSNCRQNKQFLVQITIYYEVFMRRRYVVEALAKLNLPNEMLCNLPYHVARVWSMSSLAFPIHGKIPTKRLGSKQHFKIGSVLFVR